MSQILTDQDFANAKRDISDIDKAVNTESIVDPRWGGDFKSLPLISKEWQQAINTITQDDGIPASAISTLNGQNQQSTNDLVDVKINAIESTLTEKSDKTYVDSQDSSLQSQIDQKATAAYLDSALAAQTQTVNTALSNLSTQASKFYPTLTEANADISNLEVNQVVQIGESGTNGGLWYKSTAEATSLTKSAYDPLTQSKNYTNDAINPLSVKLSELATDQYSGSYENVIPFYTDSSGKVILGFNESTEELIGAFPESGSDGETSDSVTQDYIAKPLLTELKPITSAVNGCLFYGQSLSIGMTSAGLNIPISTNQPFSNVTFSPSVKSTTTATLVKPLVEDNVLPVGSDTGYSGETPCSGAANYATLLAYKENGIQPSSHVIFSSTMGKGSASIGSLMKGNPWYDEHVVASLDKAVALNTGFKLHTFNWLQGEKDANDSTPYATYYTRLNQIQADIETDAKVKTGQTHPVHLVSYQCSTRITAGEGVVKAQYDCFKNNPKIHLSTPTYFIPRNSDGTHLTQAAYKWLGAFHGRVYKQLVIDQIEPKWLEPISATIKSNEIDVKFRVPCKPLQLNTSFLAATQDMGFKVLDGASMASINNIKIINDDTVRLTLSATPTGTITVRYALDYLASNLNIDRGCSGNVMDSTDEKCTISGVDYLMPYVAPHFEMTAVKEQF